MIRPVICQITALAASLFASKPFQMIELRLFGGFEVTGPDRERARSIISQPRRAALLIYLAVQGLRGAIRRDQLAELFWPDSEPSTARQSLRQALAFLRKALGDRAIVTRGDIRGAEEVGIDPIEVRCDVPALERYLDSGDFIRAAELYHGDLLAGFPPSGVDAFDRWLDETRDEYRRRIRDALRALSVKEAAAGNNTLAVQWARRELALEPADEDSSMRLMQRLAAANDRAGAVAVYDELARFLKTELDDEPSSEVAALVDQIRALPASDSLSLLSAQAAATAAPSIEVAIPQKSPRPAPVRRRMSRRGLTLGTVGIVIALVLVWIWRATSQPPVGGENRPTLAIMPFRVSGADPSVAYLGEGIVDLLASRLGAEPGWRVGPLAKRAGGDLLTGGIVGGGQRVVIEGTLRSGPDSAVVLTASAEGPADSISGLVDRVAAKMLFHRVGYSPAFPDQLARKPFSALQSFLRGHVALRKGQYAAAIPLLERALVTDSTFAQAALELGAAARRLGEWGPWQQGFARAWTRRDQLGRADSLYLLALAGPRFPKPAPHVENLRAWQSAVEVTPDRADGWYELGDYLLRWGPVIGIADSRMRAKAALARAMELDPALIEPVLPLMELAISDGDTATVRRLHERYVVSGVDEDAKDYLRWRTAHFFRDSTALRIMRAGMDRMSYSTLLQLIGMAQVDGVGIDDAGQAVEILRRRAVRPSEDAETKEVIAYWELNRGDAGAGRRYRLERARNERTDFQAIVLDALYDEGDSSAAALAMVSLRETPTDSATLSSPAGMGKIRAADACVEEQWRLWHGQRAGTVSTIALLRSVDRPENRACVHLIAAIDAVLGKRPDAKEKLETLDLELRTGDRPFNDLMYGNLAAAMLWERMGDPRRALAASRRRPYHHWQGPWHLAAFLAAEERLSAVIGDKASERLAARHRAAIRSGSRQ